MKLKRSCFLPVSSLKVVDISRIVELVNNTGTVFMKTAKFELKYLAEGFKTIECTQHDSYLIYYVYVLEVGACPIKTLRLKL